MISDITFFAIIDTYFLSPISHHSWKATAMGDRENRGKPRKPWLSDTFLKTGQASLSVHIYIYISIQLYVYTVSNLARSDQN